MRATRRKGPIIKYQMEWQQKVGMREGDIEREREGSGDDGGGGNREIFIGLEQKRRERGENRTELLLCTTALVGAVQMRERSVLI